MSGKVGYCRKCGKRIMFQRMKSGKLMPVDERFVNYKTVEGGKERIVTPAGEVIACVTGVSVEDATGYGYMTHFATCKKSSK